MVSTDKYNIFDKTLYLCTHKIQHMHPLKFKPIVKTLVWGTESWELSCHKDGQSVVADGEDKGLTLTQYIEKHGKGDERHDSCND